MSQYYSSQEDYEAEMDAINEYDSPGKPVSFASLKTSDNDVVFELLATSMDLSKSLQLVCGIDSGMPYYEFETDNDRKRKLYLNTDLVEYILHYLAHGQKRANRPNVMNVDKAIDETYILKLFKRDRQNNVARYNPTSKEYKAMYAHGIINYGTLPYTPEELGEKLNII